MATPKFRIGMDLRRIIEWRVAPYRTGTRRILGGGQNGTRRHAQLVGIQTDATG